MDNKQYEAWARALADLYEEAELELLEITARRLERGITQEGWAEKKLADIRQLREAHQQALDRYLEAGEIILEQGIALSYDAGSGPAYGDPVAIRTKQQALQALTQEAVNKLQTANVQILRSGEDMYKSVIADALRLSVGGVLNRRQATQRALEQFVGAGLTAFVDKAGRKWEIQSYAEMAARTGYMRAHLAGNLSKYSREGRDLVIVSVSPEPCPICDPYEGKIYSISGSSSQYPSLQSAMGGGLFHANCTHRVTPHIPGLTRPVTPAEKYNKRGENKYDERQQQRALERKVRGYKKKQAASVDAQSRAKWGNKVRGAQAQLRSFIKDTGRLRRYDREQILKADRLRAAKEARDIRREQQKALRKAPNGDGSDILDLPAPPRGRPAKDLQRWANHKYPGTQFDLEELDDRAAADVVEEIHRLAQDWPLAMQQIKYIGTQGKNSPYPYDWNDSRSFAHMARNNNYMGLNPAWFGKGKYDDFLDAVNDATENNWLAGTGKRESQAKGIICHEFGHAVHNWMRGSRGMVLPYMTPMGLMSVGRLTDLWQEKWGKTGTAKTLSQYSVYNNPAYPDSRELESFAESFVLLNYSRPDKQPGVYTKAQKRLLDVLHPARWLTQSSDISEYQYIRGMNTEEKTKAKGEVNALYRSLGLDEPYPGE